MTAFDRIERRLPELFDELASAGTPDYFDDMLLAATQSRQRPSWSALERWLPMGVIALPASTRQVPWRAIGILVILGLLIAVGSFVLVGSNPRLPAPYGLARNGALVIGTGDGDIAVIDPLTGVTTPIVGGTTVDRYPWFTPDGQRIAFSRPVAGTDTEVTYVANRDGSNARELVPAGPVIEWFDWSATGDRAVIIRPVDGVATVQVVDVATGAITTLDPGPGVAINRATWRPGHDELILEAIPGNGAQGARYFLMAPDGLSEPRPIPVPATAMSEMSVSPDGSSLAYATWAAGTGLQGRIHVIDIASGVDRPVMFEGSTGTNELSPLFSPDGHHLLVQRFGVGDLGYQLTIVPVAGGGPAIGIGPAFPGGVGAPTIVWSPDAKQVLVSYPEDESMWLLEVAGGEGQRLGWSASDGGFTWQRQAP